MVASAQATSESLSTIPSAGSLPTFEKKDATAQQGGWHILIPSVRQAGAGERMIAQRINDIAWTDEAYRCVGARDAKLVVIFAGEAVQS